MADTIGGMILLSHVPIPVAAVRDSWDWVVIWSTVAASVLAVVAIILAAWSVYRADKALVRERRQVFELSLLARLVEVCGYGGGGRIEVAKGLLLMLPETDLPELREQVEHDVVPSNEMLRRYLPEFEKAVEKRLER
jgi:biopolymer transport protein ExbB/TolQ